MERDTTVHYGLDHRLGVGVSDTRGSSVTSLVPEEMEKGIEAGHMQAQHHHKEKEGILKLHLH